MAIRGRSRAAGPTPLASRDKRLICTRPSLVAARKPMTQLPATRDSHNSTLRYHNKNLDEYQQ